MNHEAFSVVRRAKAKVAGVFKALEAHADTQWRELVQGGWEARASTIGGTLTAYVGEDGSYAVYADKHEERRITLLSGIMLDATEEKMQAVASPREGQDSLETPSFLRGANVRPKEAERLYRQEHPDQERPR